MRLLDRDGKQRSEFSNEEPIQIEIEFESDATPYIQVGIELQNQHGTPVFRSLSNDVLDLTMERRETADRCIARP